MSENNSTPLTDEERAELEALRAEKARRERAELEELRASLSDVEEETACACETCESVVESTLEQPVAKPVSSDAASTREEKTFGQRMVTTDYVDDDDVPGMPPAQKLIIGLCALLALIAGAYIVATNMGLI